MTNRRKSDKPLTTIGIRWQRNRPEDDPQAVRVRFDYSIRDNRTGERRVSGRQELEIPPMLAPFNDELLLKFFTLGTSRDVANAIRELSDDPDQESVVLKTGTLASLLRYCITPEEALSFLLNHGAVRRTSTALIDADSGPLALRAYEHTLSGALTRTRIKKAVAMCKGTAKALTKVQQISVVPELGPIPPLAPEPMAKLITGLKFLAESLAGYLPILPTRRIGQRIHSKCSFAAIGITLRSSAQEPPYTMKVRPSTRWRSKETQTQTASEPCAFVL